MLKASTAASAVQRTSLVKHHLLKVWLEPSVVAWENSLRQKCFARVGYNCQAKAKGRLSAGEAAVFSPYAKQCWRDAEVQLVQVSSSFHAKVNNSWSFLFTQHFSWTAAWCSALFTMATFLPVCLPFANQFYQHSLGWRIACKIHGLPARISCFMQMISVNRSILMSYRNPARTQNHSWCKLEYTKTSTWLCKLINLNAPSKKTPTH